MAAHKEAPDFNQIIQAQREKKRKQQLADQILGSGRRSSAPGAGNGRKPPTGPSSLASRMGVSKVRTPSASPRPRTNGNKRSNDLHAGRPQQGRPLNLRAVSTPQLNQRNHALNSVVNGGGNAPASIRNQVNVTQRATNGAGISIRGASTVTYTVVAQNFALGTTAADIEAVLVPDEVEAGLIRCKLVASNPTVIAEVLLTNKEVADTIIATYNNKKADGRLLYVYLKDPPHGMNTHRSIAAPLRPPAGTPVITIEDDEMDYDDGRAPVQDRRSQQHSRPAPRAEPDVQDGRYGFSETDYRSSESSYQDSRSSDRYARRGRGGNGGGGGGGGLVSDDMLRRDNRDNGYYRR